MWSSQIVHLWPFQLDPHPHHPTPIGYRANTQTRTKEGERRETPTKPLASSNYIPSPLILPTPLLSPGHKPGEMSERETRDFMSVDSFSQLPFIRPAPAREKNNSNSNSNSSSAAAIRLFGIEFPHEPGGEEDSSSKETTTINNNGNTSGGESSRKFECHYCCRNFPTSQALGGHQNAHKRERQHAKRAHLQSAMAAHHYQAEGHVYGLLNYHRLGSIPSSAKFGIGGRAFESPPPLSHYPSWNNTSTSGSSSSLAGSRFYSGPGSVSQPINGSPLPGFWRLPAVNGGGGHGLGLGPVRRDSSSTALPLFAGDDSRAVGGGSSNSSYESAAGVQDHLSLDLHL